ncbi:unnamed protein product [Dicrocoelium dendriticum]|nr:unnamed protein product [Dicrocoelium dendriticum]
MLRTPFDDDEPGSFGSTGTGHWDSSTARLGIETSNESFSINSQIFDSRARAQASQQRALASIANSERIGSETATELVYQGEKLQRAEQRLDDISQLQKDSQRQINTLSSVFGGIKNFFSRKQPVTTAQFGGSGSKENVAQERPPAQTTVQNKPRTNTRTDQITDRSAGSQSDFDSNLVLMSDGVSRLKNLAEGMNEELRAQNERLERMAPRVEAVTGTMARQNQQMNRLLGIKPN